MAFRVMPGLAGQGKSSLPQSGLRVRSTAGVIHRVAETPGHQQGPRRIARSVVRVLTVLVTIAAFAALAWWLKRSELLVRGIEWIRTLGSWAPAAFIALYVLAAVFGVPASVLTIGAGMLFGLVQGVACVLAAAMTAAILSFLVSRHIARDWVTEKFAARARLHLLDDAVRRDGWKIVLLMRIAPTVPFAITNYLFGLTRVPLWQYTLASFAMLPATVFYVYLGTLAGDFGELKSTAIPIWARVVFAIFGVLALLYISRVASRALRQREDAPSGTPARN